MADTQTAQRLKRDAKKNALRTYKKVYDNLSATALLLIEMPDKTDPEYEKVFGEMGPFVQVYGKVEEILDAMSTVAVPSAVDPDELIPEEEPVSGEPYELQSEVGVGGEEDMEEVSVAGQGENQ